MNNYGSSRSGREMMEEIKRSKRATICDTIALVAVTVWFVFFSNKNLIDITWMVVVLLVFFLSYIALFFLERKYSKAVERRFSMRGEDPFKRVRIR